MSNWHDACCRAMCSPALLLLGAMSALPAAAQDAELVKAVLKSAPNSGAVGELIQDVTLDMPIATPAAAVVLGVASAQVPRVASFREAALTLSNGLDKQGRITQAVGAEFSPAMLLRPVKWTELDRLALRLWVRTTVSFATLPSEKSGDARTALGVQTVLYSKEAEEAVATAAGKDCQAIARRFQQQPDVPALQPGAAPSFTDADQALLKACMQLIDRSLNRWNPTTLAVGYGQAFYSSDGGVKGLASSAGSLWVTGAWGLDFDNMRVAADQRAGLGLTAHWRRSNDERAADPAGGSQLLAESARLWALNLRIGTPRLALLAEHSRRRSELAGHADEQRRRSLLGAEVRLAKGLYAAIGVTDDRGARDGTERRAALANLKWGLGDKSVLGGL